MTTELTFGQWLRRRRKALDLTQAELARQVGCAKVTLQKIELEERRPSREIVERLLELLRVASEDHGTVMRAARGEWLSDGLPEAHATPSTRPATLPWPSSTSHMPAVLTTLPASTTPLVGRAYEVAFIRALLRQPTPRLLTVTGTGGVGKTRVALEVAQLLTDDFPDGVVFVSLAMVSDPTQVGPAIARALGLAQATGQQPGTRLGRYLYDKHLLLVLDNFEHLLDAALLVAELLTAAPRLKILVTSRAPLRVGGEQECPLLPLPVPDLERLPSAGELLQHAAVELFLQRVQAVQPTFCLTEANGRTVAELCVGLDGLPLAIELVAARVKVLGLEPLARGLQSRLTLLTKGARDLPLRQQTLRATIEWSFGLLALRERTLFACLAVFAGGWTLEAADVVCGEQHTLTPAADGMPSMSIVDSLQSLVDHSLIQHRDAGGEDARYSMLETIAEYARERLAASEQREEVCRRHAAWVLSLAERADLEWYSPQQERWFRRLADEHNNVRAALAWLEENQQIEPGVRIAAALGPYWTVRGVVAEGRRWLDKVQAYDTLFAQQFQTKVLHLAAWLALYQHDMALAETRSRESLTLAREMGDQKAIAEALRPLGTALMQRGARQEALDVFGEAMTIYETSGDRYGIANVLFQRGLGDLVMGNVAAARHLAEQSLTYYSACGVTLETGEALVLCGWTQLADGAFEEAAGALREGLARLAQSGESYFSVGGLLGLAGVAAGTGDLLRAARLFGAADALSEMTMIEQPTTTVVSIADIRDAVRAALGNDTYEAARADGRSMTRARAIRFALAES